MGFFNDSEILNPPPDRIIARIEAEKRVKKQELKRLRETMVTRIGLIHTETRSLLEWRSYDSSAVPTRNESEQQAEAIERNLIDQSQEQTRCKQNMTNRSSILMNIIPKFVTRPSLITCDFE